MIALFILIFGFSLAGLLYFVGKWLQEKVVMSEMKIDDIILSAFGRPLISLVIITTIWSALYYGTSLPEVYPDIFHSHYLTAFYIFIGAWIIAGFFSDFFSHYKTDLVGTQDKKGQNSYYFFKKGIIYLVWIIGALLILSTLHIDIGPLLATGGVIGLIISLGGQDVISNFLSGLVIATDKPIRIGDRIKVGEQFGDIIEIGSYSSRMKTLDNQIITIPNTLLTNDVVINYALPNEQIKVRVNIGVAYGTDVSKVKDILVRIGKEAGEIGLCLREFTPEAYFLEFASSSLNFQLIVVTDQYSKSWDVLDYINTRIDAVFKDEGIEIPFPQMDIHMR